MQADRRPLEAVGTAVFAAGRRTYGELVLAHHVDGPVATPVAIIGGRQPGPVLWVQAALHGGESGGTLGIARCLDRLDPDEMTGAIVAVMAANPLAFRAQTRITPQDGENMNRVFPGTRAGTITRQMAHRLMETAEATADAVIDLHSSGLEAIVPLYSLFWDDGSEASIQASSLARNAGTQVVWAAQDSWLSGSMFANLTRRGLPALILECGGGGAVPDEHIEAFARGIEGVARALEILPGGPVRQQRYRTIGACDLVFTQEGGFFVPACEAGDVLQRGAVVGRVLDPFGTEREVITAAKPAYVAAIGRRFLPVHSGTMVAELNDDKGWEAV
jgi:predicted deacylase